MKQFPGQATTDDLLSTFIYLLGAVAVILVIVGLFLVDTGLVRRRNVLDTVVQKIGGAVIRNRAKRRLREVARKLLPELGRPGFDYVLIARSGTPSRPWERLLDDVKSALIRLAADSEAPERPASTQLFHTR